MGQITRRSRSADDHRNSQQASGVDEAAIQAARAKVAYAQKMVNHYTNVLRNTAPNDSGYHSVYQLSSNWSAQLSEALGELDLLTR